MTTGNAPRPRWSSFDPDLFQAICEQETEGIVAKQAAASYTPDATTWVKIKNRQYSRTVGRHNFFDGHRVKR